MRKTLHLSCLLLLLAAVGPARAQINVLHDVQCNGAASGALIASPSGWGNAPYTYVWSTAATTQSIHDLVAGTYSVTITDSLGADSVFSAILSEPPAVLITPGGITASDCDGHNNGFASISASGGVPPYAFAWHEQYSDSLYFTASVGPVRGGSYQVTATDLWGCWDTALIVIPNLWTVPVTFTIDSFVCNGLLGAMSVRADSADSASYYTYTWSSKYSSTTFLTNDSVFSTGGSFPAGEYLITTWEMASGCANYSWIVIDQTEAPLVVTESAIHNQCYGNTTGSVTLFPTGGLPLPGYHCVWSGPDGFTSSAFSIGGLASGDYSYVVTDDSACSYSGTVRIEPLMPLQGALTLTGVSCDEGRYGEAVANFSGGSGMLSYQWSGGETTTSVPLIAPGLYCVTVTDMRGCVISDSVAVDEGDEICLYIPNMVTANGDGYNDAFRVEGACEMDEFTVTIFTADGKEVFSSEDCSFAWNPLDYRKSSAGTVFYYFIRVAHGARVAEYKNSINVNY